MTFFTSDNWTTAATSCTSTTWITAAPDTIHLGWQGFILGIDYVKEKIIAVFEDREKIRAYRKALFNEKTRLTTRKFTKQLYTIMIPSKRNFRGQESQRK